MVFFGTILLNVVGEFCNMACKYCYGSFIWKRNKKPIIIKRGTLEDTINKINEYIEFLSAFGRRKIDLIIHGNEPLQAPDEVFKYIVENLDSRVSIGIQTNGTLIRESLLKILSEREELVGISVSIDPPKDVNDKVRVLHNGNGSYEKIMKGLKLLEDFGFPKYVITVITKLLVGKEKALIEWYYSHDISAAKVIPVHLPKDHPYYEELQISPENLKKFYLNLYILWRDDYRELHLDPYAMLIKSIAMNSIPSECSFSGACPSIITIDYDGKITACERPNIVYGNIHNVSLRDLLFSEERVKITEIFRNRVSFIEKECGNCKYLKFCHGGCPSENEILTGNFYSKTPFCIARKALFKQIEEDIKKVIGVV